MGNVRDLSKGMERDLVEVYLSVPLFLISFLSPVIKDVRRLFRGYEWINREVMIILNIPKVHPENVVLNFLILLFLVVIHFI